MAIKSILVHVANDPRHSDRLELAVDLCRQVQGHLDVVFTTSPITMPAAATGRAASTVFLAEARDIAMRRVEALQADVAAHFSRSPEVLTAKQLRLRTVQRLDRQVDKLGTEDDDGRNEQVAAIWQRVLHLPDRPLPH